MIPKGHLIRLNSNRHLFTLAQASAEAGKFCLVPGQTSLPPQGPVYPCAGLCRGRGSFARYKMSRDLSCTRPNFAGGRSRPQTGACLPLRRLQDVKQAPVYPYADCRAPNRRLFTLAQIAGRQTGACLPLRRLQDTKQAPVYRCTDCRDPNRRLFTLTQIAGRQTGACLPLHKLQGPKQAPVYPYAGLCRGRGSLSWYPPNFAAPAGALFGFFVHHFSVSLYMASISAA